jgi:uncharacterized protein (DUF2252 family)
MDNVGETILNFNRGRDPERLHMKYASMRRSAFAFLRGSCHLFYAQLPAHPLFDTAPPVWSCGDLHLENFGSYRGEDHLAYFDINDFDESALAPLTWDVVRFLTSLLVGALEMMLDEDDAQALCRVFLDAYNDTLSSGKTTWIERATAGGLLRDLLDSVTLRSRADFLDSRTTVTGGKRRLRIDGRKALAASAQDQQRVTRILDDFSRTQEDPGFYRAIDIARRVAGTGSLGVERYVILVHGKGGPDGHHLLDLKQALPSSLAEHLDTAQPHWHDDAERVVALQRRLQAVSIASLHAIADARTCYVLRALLPSEDRVTLNRDVESFTRIASVVQSMGKIAASAHLRGAGRDQSATTDELIAFSGDLRWQHTLYKLALRCASQVEQDWRSFCRDYDDGLFEFS